MFARATGARGIYYTNCHHFRLMPQTYPFHICLPHLHSDRLKMTQGRLYAMIWV